MAAVLHDVTGQVTLALLWYYEKRSKRTCCDGKENEDDLRLNEILS